MDPICELLLILAGLYLFECVAWVRNDTWLLREALLGRVNRMATASETLNNGRRGACFLSVLPFDCAFATSTRAPDEHSLDFERARWRRAFFVERARTLRLSTTLLAAFLFVYLPTVWYTVGIGERWPWLLGVYFLLVGASVSSFWTLHRRYAGRDRATRIRKAILFALAPTSLLRAVDCVSRGVLREYHPLAVARCGLDDAAFRAFARSILRDLHWPLPDSPQDSDAPARRAIVERALERAGFPAEELLTPPERSSAESVAYCPRCEEQFARSDAHCESCGDRELLPFESTSLEAVAAS